MDWISLISAAVTIVFAWWRTRHPGTVSPAGGGTVKVSDGLKLITSLVAQLPHDESGKLAIAAKMFDILHVTPPSPVTASSVDAIATILAAALAKKIAPDPELPKP